MHAYEVPRRQVPPPIPSARAATDGGPSATPIYDALYAEYVKTFRSLPGDRSGEEELGFSAFGSRPSGSFSSSYSAYSAGANSARHGIGQQSQWQRVGQFGQHGTMTHVPAALPPAVRGI